MNVHRVVLFTVVASCAGAQSQQGAKALFLDPTSGVAIQSSRPAARPQMAHQAAQPVAGARPEKAANEGDLTGLMYWFEQLTEQGQILRVSSSRGFKSGDRIRLNVRSNIKGDLTIMQSQNGAPFSLLFPTKESAGNTVQAYQDMAFPSSTGWFRFDQKPGDVRLLVMVRATSPALSGSESRPSLSSSSPASIERRPAPVESARAATNAPSPEAVFESELKRQTERLQGSKALMVEEDSTSNSPASYVVVDRRKDDSVPSGVLALEIILSHRSN